MKKFMILSFCAISLIAADKHCQSDEAKILINDMKSQLPMKSDEVTTIYDIECKDAKLIYKYSLEDNATFEFSKYEPSQKSRFNDTQSLVLRSFFCKNATSLRNAFDGVIAQYSLKNGDEFANVEVKQSDCKEISTH